MEELIIRFGGIEGIRNPTLADVERVIRGIETDGVGRRPEFTIEPVDNWRYEVVDGRPSHRRVDGGTSMCLAHFSPDDEGQDDGWFVTFREGDSGYALARDDLVNGRFVEGVCFGNPLTVRADCVVPVAQVLLAAETYLDTGTRCPMSRWLYESLAYDDG